MDQENISRKMIPLVNNQLLSPDEEKNASSFSCIIEETSEPAREPQGLVVEELTSKALTTDELPILPTLSPHESVSVSSNAVENTSNQGIKVQPIETDVQLGLSTLSPHNTVGDSSLASPPILHVTEESTTLALSLEEPSPTPQPCTADNQSGSVQRCNLKRKLPEAASDKSMELNDAKKQLNSYLPVETSSQVSFPSLLLLPVLPLPQSDSSTNLANENASETVKRTYLSSVEPASIIPETASITTPYQPPPALPLVPLDIENISLPEVASSSSQSISLINSASTSCLPYQLSETPLMHRIRSLGFTPSRLRTILIRALPRLLRNQRVLSPSLREMTQENVRATFSIRLRSVSRRPNRLRSYTSLSRPLFSRSFYRLRRSRTIADIDNLDEIDEVLTVSLENDRFSISIFSPGGSVSTYSTTFQYYLPENVTQRESSADFQIGLTAPVQNLSQTFCVTLRSIILETSATPAVNIPNLLPLQSTTYRNELSTVSSEFSESPAHELNATASTSSTPVQSGTFSPKTPLYEYISPNSSPSQVDQGNGLDRDMPLDPVIWPPSGTSEVDSLQSAYYYDEASQIDFTPLPLVSSPASTTQTYISLQNAQPGFQYTEPSLDNFSTQINSLVQADQPVLQPPISYDLSTEIDLLGSEPLSRGFEEPVYEVIAAAPTPLTSVQSDSLSEISVYGETSSAASRSQSSFSQFSDNNITPIPFSMTLQLINDSLPHVSASEYLTSSLSDLDRSGALATQQACEVISPSDLLSLPSPASPVDWSPLPSPLPPPLTPPILRRISLLTPNNSQQIDQIVECDQEMPLDPASFSRPLTTSAGQRSRSAEPRPRQSKIESHEMTQSVDSFDLSLLQPPQRGPSRRRRYSSSLETTLQLGTPPKLARMASGSSTAISQPLQSTTNYQPPTNANDLIQPISHLRAEQLPRLPEPTFLHSQVGSPPALFEPAIRLTPAVSPKPTHRVRPTLLPHYNTRLRSLMQQPSATHTNRAQTSDNRDWREQPRMFEPRRVQNITLPHRLMPISEAPDILPRNLFLHSLPDSSPRLTTHGRHAQARNPIHSYPYQYDRLSMSIEPRATLDIQFPSAERERLLLRVARRRTAIGLLLICVVVYLVRFFTER